MTPRSKLLDLIERLATSTVRQLRDRARELRDRHSMKNHFCGLWSWRKKELVRKVAEAELAHLDYSAEEETTMLFKSIEARTAEAVIRGAARGVQALGSDSIEEYQDLAGSVGEDVANGKDVFEGEAKGLDHNAGENGKAPAKKSTTKSK